MHHPSLHRRKLPRLPSVSLSLPTLETIARGLLPAPGVNRVLAPNERRTLKLAADALLDGVDAFEVDLEEVATNVEQFLGATSARRAWRARVLLTLFEIAPMLPVFDLATRRRTFSRLTRDERIAFINAKLVDHPNHIWSICSRIRPLVYLGAYASRSARNGVGFIPVPERARFLKKTTKTTTPTISKKRHLTFMRAAS